MTNSEQAIREFAENWGDYMEVDEQGRWSLYNHRNEMYNALTALIREHYYPKEFLLWTHSQDYWLFDSLTCLWVSDEPSVFQEGKTTDELFNYWRENERC